MIVQYCLWKYNNVTVIMHLSPVIVLSFVLSFLSGVNAEAGMTVHSQC